MAAVILTPVRHEVARENLVDGCLDPLVGILPFTAERP